MSPVAAAGLSPIRHALANGVVLLTEHTATHPAVTIYATLDAGNLHDPDSSPGLANFVARVIDRGTESRSPDEIAEALDGRGVSLTAGVTRHLLSLSCTCLSEDIEAIMTLVADVIRRPSLPADQVEKRRTAIVTAGCVAVCSVSSTTPFPSAWRTGDSPAAATGLIRRPPSAAARMCRPCNWMPGDTCQPPVRRRPASPQRGDRPFPDRRRPTRRCGSTRSGGRCS